MPNFEIFLLIAVLLCAITLFFCRFIKPELSKRQPEPWYLDYARSFFPVLLIVFLLRGFVAEPFRIPSGSMLPTLKVGDFILVNKFSYGIKLPIVHHKIVDFGDPQRGDIVVFRWPRDNRTSFIKRLVGLPGDTITYRNKVLSINGQRAGQIPQEDYLPFGEVIASDQFTQVVQSSAEDGSESERVSFSILQKKHARSKAREGTWVVPEGHYFMMGDNRDNSHDSRGWGFVPEENIVGKAFFVWFHYNFQSGGGLDFSRIGTRIEAQSLAPE